MAVRIITRDFLHPFYQATLLLGAETVDSKVASFKMQASQVGLASLDTPCSMFHARGGTKKTHFSSFMRSCDLASACQ